MYHIFYFLLCLVYISSCIFSLLSIIYPCGISCIPNPTNRLHQPNPIRLARHTGSKNARPHNQHNTSRLCRPYSVCCFRSLRNLLLSLRLLLAFHLFLHDLAADLQCFFCRISFRVRESFPSEGAAGSARTLRSVLPLKAQAQLLFCCCVSFLCLYNCRFPFHRFRIRSHFFFHRLLQFLFQLFFFFYLFIFFRSSAFSML